MTMVTLLACRFDHACAYKGINMSMTSKAFLVGGGIGSLAAAFMIRDGKLPGTNITILEASPVLGGSLDGAGDAGSGYQLLDIRHDIPRVTRHAKSLQTQFEALLKAFK